MSIKCKNFPFLLQDIIPYKPYLKLTYIPIHSLDSLVETFATETNTPSVDSVEGIMFTLNDGVIMSGEFVDDYEVCFC